MAERRQFGGGGKGEASILSSGELFPVHLPGDGDGCARCEAMLADALDGTLSDAEQMSFDQHAANCVSCAERLADARRGAALLDRLRNSAPMPSSELLQRILAQTSPMALTGEGSVIVARDDVGQAAALAPGLGAKYGIEVPFTRRVIAVLRRTSFGQIVLQPRLAMTAAMAFFSVALTMNLMGIHPAELSDLSPMKLRRDAISVNSDVARYYESLRVVYELESRLHDLQSAQDADAQATDQGVPGVGSAMEGIPAAAPVHEPHSEPDERRGEPRPAETRPAPGSGTSRREEFKERRRFNVSLGRAPEAVGTKEYARIERRVA